jgi:hypothetical protein
MGRVLYALRLISDIGADRPLKVHHDRDAWVLGRLTCAVRRPGDRVDALFNVPGPDLNERSVRNFMRHGDLVLVTTRLPANERCPEGDDEKWYARKPVISGNNWLGTKILECSRDFVGWCNRKYVLLTPVGASCLAPEFRNRASAHFHSNDDATYEQVSIDVSGSNGQLVHPKHIAWHRWKANESGVSTAGYILHLKQLWPDGPGCLMMFGMSGETTYGFVSAVTEIWGQLPSGIEFDDSEMIFVEISSGAGDKLIPAQPPGHPTYWREWRFAWNRGGRLTDWPATVPAPAR